MTCPFEYALGDKENPKVTDLRERARFDEEDGCFYVLTRCDKCGEAMGVVLRDAARRAAKDEYELCISCDSASSASSGILAAWFIPWVW